MKYRMDRIKKLRVTDEKFHIPYSSRFEEDGVYTISAEVFGKGIDMWLRSQGDLMKTP